MTDRLTQQQLRELSVQAGLSHFPSIMRFLRGIADGIAQFPISSALVTAWRSTAARTLQDRFGEQVNVRDFGARGDGLTDDHAAIARAIAVAAELGRAVYFPAGTYMSSPIETPVSIHLSYGATLKAIDGLSGSHLVTITAHGVRLYGPGAIDGNKAGAPAGWSCIYARGRHNLEIADLTIRNAGRHGIGLYDASGLRVRNVRVSGNTWAHVQVYVDQEALSDVVIDGVEASGPGRAVAVSNISPADVPGGKKTIRGVHFRRCTATDAGAAEVVMEIWCGGQVKAFNCTFEACRVTGGLFAFSFDGVAGGTMVDCHAIGPAQIGYELADSPGSRVVNGTLDIMGSIGAEGAPAPLTPVSISGASANAEVSDILIIDSVGTGKALRAIYVGDTSHGVTISRNRVLATVQQGIVLNAVRHQRVVTQNIFASVVADALAAYYADGLRVLSGLKIGAAFNGILLLGDGATNDIRIEGNDLRNCTNGAFNPQGAFGPDVWLLGNDGVLDWQQPLHLPPTGTAPRRQLEIDQVLNATSCLHVGASDGSNPGYLAAEDGGLALKSSGVTGLVITDNGSAVCGAGALATNATDGFLYGAYGAGPPTGTPTAQGGIPFYFDTVNRRLYAYIGGAWRYVNLT